MGNIGPVLTQALGVAAPVVGLPLGGVIATSALSIAERSRARSAQKQEQSIALQQLQAQQTLQSGQLAAQTALERERIQMVADVDADNRRAALKRAVARRRAEVGASGIGGGAGGSTQAVLLGLFDETEDELNERQVLDTLRTRALDLSLSNNNAINILQRTQLQERQKLSRISTNFKI